jgi:hypothetical protein
MKCTHGVELILDKGHSCFECEKWAIDSGLPLEARQVNAQEVMREMWAERGNPMPADTNDTEAMRKWAAACTCPACTLRRDLKANMTEAPTFKPTANGHHPEGPEALAAKLSPQVEGLAISEWWRERYGTKAARGRTRAAALAASALTDVDGYTGPRDINGDPDPIPTAGTPAELEVEALTAELKALQRAFLGVRAELAATHHANRQLRRAMNEATATLQIVTADTATG